MRIGIVGTGSVGRALAEGFVRAKHEVRLGSRNPKRAKGPRGTRTVAQKDAVEGADVVVLAVPYDVIPQTVYGIGPATFDRKVLIDVTNPLTPSGELAVGFAVSGAEELAHLVPSARVVKAFNTEFAGNMSTGKIGRERLTLLVAGNDDAAKKTVMKLGRDLGFDPVDAGPLRSARYLEPLAMQLMTLAYVLKMGPDIGLHLIRRTRRRGTRGRATSRRSVQRK